MALSYNVMVGVEWYGKGKNLYFIPTIGFLLSAINFVLYKVLRNSGEFLPFLAVFTAIFIQIILMISLLFLIRLN